MDSAGETISVFNMMAMGASALAAEEAPAAAGPAGKAAAGAGAGTRPSSASSTSSSASAAASAVPTSADSALRRERKEIITGDSLLRIMTDTAAHSINEVIAFAEKGNLARISDLVDSNFDGWAQCRGLGGFTPLHYAASRGHAAVCAELLRAWPAMASTANDAGETALHLAASGESLLLVEQLLDRGGAPNGRTRQGETPLNYAAQKGRAAVVRLLLQRGADPTLQVSVLHVC